MTARALRQARSESASLTLSAGASASDSRGGHELGHSHGPPRRLEQPEALADYMAYPWSGLALAAVMGHGGKLSDLSAVPRGPAAGPVLMASRPTPTNDSRRP